MNSGPEEENNFRSPYLQQVSQNQHFTNATNNDIRIDIQSTQRIPLPQEITPRSSINGSVSNEMNNGLRNSLTTGFHRAWGMSMDSIFSLITPGPLLVRNQWMPGSRNLFYSELRSSDTTATHAHLTATSVNTIATNSELTSPTVAALNNIYQQNHSGLQNSVDQVTTPELNDPSIQNNINEEVLSAEMLSQYFNTISRYLPFVVLFCVKLLLDNFGAVGDLILLNGIVIVTNTSLIEQVGKQSQRHFSILSRDLLLLIGTMGIRYLSEPYFRNIGDQSTLSVSHILLTVIVTDLTLKIITIAIKIVVATLPPNIMQFRKQGRTFLLIEALSQLVRCFPPIQHWIYYLWGSYNGLDVILGSIFASLYLGLKMIEIIDRFKFLKIAFMKYLQNMKYGSQPSSEQIASVGGLCSICHDIFVAPVLLKCNHIFCDLCVGTWFTREQTCPLCRAKVSEDPIWQNGATTYFFQLF